MALDSYEKILIMFSGGKDSLALISVVLDAGIPKSRIELWHQDVDGEGPPTFDWPSTPSYCRQVAAHLGLDIVFAHRSGGLRGEMLRDNQPTAPIIFEGPDGIQHQTGGLTGKPGTRLRFPALSADLTTRYCSAYTKIDVAAAALRNSPRFLGRRTLVLTGERAQESAARARYKTFEPHRTDTRNSPRTPRLVDHWRPIHGWAEQDVWAAMRSLGIMPHPAYRLGFGRLSCRCCIFGSADQWATIRTLYPDAFDQLAAYEHQFQHTLRKGITLPDFADRGTPYRAALDQPRLAAAANDPACPAGPIAVPPADWTLPAGAFTNQAGPT